MSPAPLGTSRRFSRLIKSRFATPILGRTRVAKDYLVWIRLSIVPLCWSSEPRGRFGELRFQGGKAGCFDGH